MFINHRSTMWRTEPIRWHAGSYRRHQSVPGTVQRFPQNHRHPIDQRDEMSVHTAHTAETITVNKQGCLSWEQENARQTLPREYTEKKNKRTLIFAFFLWKNLTPLSIAPSVLFELVDSKMAHLYTQRGLTKHETLSAFLFCFFFFSSGAFCVNKKNQWTTICWWHCIRKTTFSSIMLVLWASCF